MLWQGDGVLRGYVDAAVSLAGKLLRIPSRPLRWVRNWTIGRYSCLLMQRLYKRSTVEPEVSTRILFWIPGGMPSMLDVEGALAGALMLRGASVSAVLCNGAYRACVRRDIRDNRPIRQWADDCASCTAATTKALNRMAVPYTFIGDYVDEGTRARLHAMSRTVSWENLEHFKYDGIDIGKNVRSAIIRYLQGHDYRGHEELVQEYAYSALVCVEAARKAYDRFHPAKVFMSHGVYVDWGPALHVALAKGIQVVAWMASYLKARFYFRNVEDDMRIDFHNMSENAWRLWRNVPLTTAQARALDDFLSARYLKKSSFDMKRLKEYSGNIEQLRAKYRLPSDKPVWGILAHINWDTVSDYAPMAYESFNQWMIDTVTHASGNKDVTWIVKVHPAESWDNPDSGVENLIKTHFPGLPEHVRVFGAEEEISPLEFYQLVNGGITVYGTAGLELALLGKPVICAGEAHYGGKGFTHDGLTVASYREMLQKASSIGPLDDEQKMLARRYAHVYFLRRQIPLSVVDDPMSDWWRFRLDRRKRLIPGNDPFVDFICDRIADGRDFILDDHLVDVIASGEEVRGKHA